MPSSVHMISAIIYWHSILLYLGSIPIQRIEQGCLNIVTGGKAANNNIVAMAVEESRNQLIYMGQSTSRLLARITQASYTGGVMWLRFGYGGLSGSLQPDYTFLATSLPHSCNPTIALHPVNVWRPPSIYIALVVWGCSCW